MGSVVSHLMMVSLLVGVGQATKAFGIEATSGLLAVGRAPMATCTKFPVGVDLPVPER